MTAYMEPRESAHYWFGDDERRILEVLSGRYAGANPPVPFALRAFAKSGVLQTREGQYDMDLSAKLPEAADGDYAYVYGLVWSDDERSIDGIMEPLGPVRLYVNEEQLYRSNAVDEMKPGARAVIPLLLRKGWNAVLVEARKTEAGFGCRFGADEAKVRIMQVLAPFAGREGSAGWVFTGPMKSQLFDGERGFPDFKQAEEETGITWLPRVKWKEEELKLPNCERLFGRPVQPAAAYGWSGLSVPAGADTLMLEGSVLGPTVIWLDGRKVAELEAAGSYRTEVPAGSGSRQLLVRSIGGSGGWGFEVNVYSGGRLLPLELPAAVHGGEGAWLYAGPLDPAVETDPAAVCTMDALYAAVDSEGRAAGHTYWMVDAPQSALRPYYENAMLSNKWTTGSATNYGRWDYPLGVTMYGLLRTARELDRKDLEDYALGHIRSCTDMYEYSLWDRDQYGFPSVNHQLVLIKMLDNCGSFGSAMLEAYLQTGDDHFLRIADVIADFMLCRLERREDGAFYRLCPGDYAADTMWADDLYMSAPFLIRYAAATGNREALDEAGRQFLHYKRYLFMEQEGVMSHVFDFKYGKATRVPWGRGNGWCLFSLSELLEKLPDDHQDWEALLSMFRELCAGVAALQADSGLWRQVLNQPDAYEEASCTAMFAYAFARGVRFGWLKGEDGYAAAALKAWKGLTGGAIDRQGNVHGVCSGSRYSFAPDYYMYDLRTVVNDNHGIGIMMLAGVEIRRMKSAAARDEQGAEERAEHSDAN
ncbi:glycoside hydrolase family 88 protein [Paenibacillus alkaliterrae]|uniref:glycoside hydrolase family 88/105 protein n=1 Tax=Paenibacillus alkaliterrae TaxID=320909 RepID=UPI001F273AE3|nr:glycoside hydrolase family 88 protein [Paenibacillus alkaliterrae]MCF2939712.1 glycoside hydrolase family 88 protein [Paenibacillus alkaliterrae]